jgi:hypothetical protein
MKKHLQNHQVYDSFYNEEYFADLSGDPPNIDPDYIDEEEIYDMIDDTEFEDMDFDELGLDDYEELNLI